MDSKEAQLAWWDDWFTTRGLDWPWDFEARFQPERPVPDRLAPYLTRSVTSLLDVGSGPVSRVGRGHAERRIELTCVDPLAAEYRDLLQRHGFDPSLAPLRGAAEDLETLFGEGRFDVINVENTLDHCLDPARALRAMLATLRPGGVIAMVHLENQASAPGYCGPCRWNFTLEGGHAVIWNASARVDVDELLRGRVTITSRRIVEPGRAKAIETTIQKLPSVETVSSPTLLQGSVRRKAHWAALAWTLVRTDFKLRYHGSTGGFAWALLRPLTLFLVLQAVFSVIFITDNQYRWSLIIGLFIWEFFVESTRAGLAALVAKGHLVTKVKVPSGLLVACSSANAVFMLGCFVVIILVAFAVSGSPLTAKQVALFVFYLVQFYAVVLGFSLVASVWFLRFRDLNQLWDLAIQVGFFAAPIVYPLAILPERMHVYLYAWPPTPIIQFSREVLLANSVPSLKAHAILLTASISALLIGIFVFRKHAPRAAEYL